MSDEHLRATQEALVLLTRIVSQAVQMTAHCAMALETAGKLPSDRALPIAAAMKQIAELMEDYDDPEPSDLAQALHEVAAVLEAAHRDTPH